MDPVNQIAADKPILFTPDQNLGRWVQRQSGRELTLWPGRCMVHEAFSEEGRIPLAQFMGELNKYLVGVDKVWCQGPQFDMVILENLFTQFNHHKGWAFWQIMDCRTIFNMMPVDPRKAIQQNLHSADADAYYQAVCVQQTYKHFTVLER